MKRLGKKRKEKAVVQSSAEVKKTEREKIDERRDEILAKGRKFKYPLQYSKHKLVINTIIIALAGIVIMSLAGWFALYKAQSSADVLYRITRILPLSVGKVDGKDVRFSDYLMIYRSSIKTVGSGQPDVDFDVLSKEYKKIALDSAEEYTYALKLAEEFGIEVSDERVAELFSEHRKVDGVERSEESFLKVLQDNFGLSKSEYERMLYLSLIKMEVEKKIDENASKLVSEIERALAKNDGDLSEAAASVKGEIYYEETGGMIDSRNVDGGRASVAFGLEKGEVSEAFVSSSGDGFYFVKLIDKNEETSQVNYVSIKIPFTEFAKRMAEVRENGGVEEYINVRDQETE